MADKTARDAYGYVEPPTDLHSIQVLGYTIAPWSALGATSTEAGSTATICDFISGDYVRKGRLSMSDSRQITETTKATEYYQGQGYVVSNSYATVADGAPVIITAVSLPEQLTVQAQDQDQVTQYTQQGVNPQDLYWPNYPIQ